ncbi:unnamed protein product [marine sediment metagenome]|uniref:Uncharacterized protein n=1 Tax=marine sediment metagenome TaxID=412755 RepID=X1CV39_9ZZZZ
MTGMAKTTTQAATPTGTPKVPITVLSVWFVGLAGAMMLGTCAVLVEVMSIRIAPVTIWAFAALSLPK